MQPRVLSFALLVSISGCSQLVGGDDWETLTELDPVQLEADRQYCVDAINGFRAMNGLPALNRSPTMEVYADEGAQVDAYSGVAHHHFHTTPFTGPNRSLGENEVRNWSMPKYGSAREIIRRGLLQMWAEGPGGGHYENMIKNFDEVGCGFHLDVAKQELTVVHDFRGL